VVVGFTTFMLCAAILQFLLLRMKRSAYVSLLLFYFFYAVVATSLQCCILFDEELDYNAPDLLSQSENLLMQLNSEQRHAFDTIVNIAMSNDPGFFFVSGYGGTGKTFLWNVIITYPRGHRKIVLTIASSGVASLLLPRGRTAHSRFKIPYDNLDKSTTCNIKRGTLLCELIQAAALII
jgi:hypothetical protein